MHPHQLGKVLALVLLAILAVASAPRVSFLNDVEPILSRAGCNQGACHGSQFGKGGFKLSLFGYEPETDHESLVKGASGRRLDFRVPERSLLLRKAALEVPHAGGKRFSSRSPDYRLLARWIRDGAEGPRRLDPRIVSLVADPLQFQAKPGTTAKLIVRAFYSDGTSRDVTQHARTSSLDSEVASVTPAGQIVVRRQGETSVMVRYSGLATSVGVRSPYGRLAAARTELDLSPVGRSIEEGWRSMGLAPSGTALDTAFLRRASLDILGTLPTPEEVRSFLLDHSLNKRAKLVDRLLDRPEYADYWSLKWADLLRSSRLALGPKGAVGLATWLRQRLSDNTPFDVLVRELVMASGSGSEVGPAGFYRVSPQPGDLAEATAQLFLGIRLQCAKCHQHPFEKWSQEDYYRFAAYFARTGVAKGAEATGEFVRPIRAGDIRHPKSGALMTPLPLSEGMANIATKPFETAGSDRREALAVWLTSKENRTFARMAANRYWAHFLGRGIVEPVDDMRVTNPSSNPALLDGLAAAFVQSGFDLKSLIRTIVLSRAYGLSSEPVPGNREDSKFYARFYPRRMPAEVLLDAVASAAGAAIRVEGLPEGTRAISMSDPSLGPDFLDAFGRPPRSTVCECERSQEKSLVQALQLMNGETVARLLAAPEGRVARLAREGIANAAAVEELYLAALSRLPSPAERERGEAALRSGQDKKTALEDILWALVNTEEFQTVR